MKFWIWFVGALVLCMAVIPVIMITAWKIAGYIMALLVAAIFFLIWRIRQDRRSFF